MSQSRARLLALAERAGIAALIASILTAIATSLPATNVLQGWISDASVAARVEIIGSRPLTADNVLIIGMDQRTLNSPELSRIPQAMFSPAYAKLAQKALDHGARGLIIDVILAYDAKDLQLDEDAPLRRYDDAFLKLLKSERKAGRVVLGRSAGVLPARRFRLIAGARGIGMVEVPQGPGGVVRRVPTVWPDRDGKLHPTLSGRALSLMGHETTEIVTLLPPDAITNLPIVSMIDVLRCGDVGKVRALLGGKMLFLGGVLPGQDRLRAPDVMIERAPEPPRNIEPDDASVACQFHPPFVRAADEPTMPGVFIHAAAVDAVIAGWQVEQLGRVPVLALIFLSGFMSALVSIYFRPALGIAAMTFGAGMVFLTSVAALEQGYFLPVAWAIVAGPVGFLAGYGLRIRLLDRKSNLMRREFGRYLSPVLVQQMVDTGQLPQLAGEERDVTVMFADLRGFTAASEKVGSADLMLVLNRYLDAMASVIATRGGYVDKFIGDAVMAIFNAPAHMDDHVHQAVAAGHEIADRIGEMARADQAAGAVSFGIKVGIATGTATLGNVGARDRVNYTVVGEIVNLAARLEGMPSLFGTPIVIGPHTAKAVEGRYRLLRIATIQVKGKTTGDSIYAPFDDPETAELNGLIAAYHIALDRFEAGMFDEADAAWTKLMDLDWPGAPIARAMVREARKLAAAPPESWKGVLAARPE